MQHLEPREWKLRESEFDKSGLDPAQIEEIAAKTGLSSLVVRLCLKRGLGSAEQILSHLDPRLDQLSDPFSIADMDRAVQRLIDARDSAQKVRIFADYDVDGTCGGALLGLVLKELGFDCEVKQPDRFKDGYGLNVPAVEQAAEAGVKLLVTVDCGITAFAPIQRANELGMEVIVVDHHQIDKEKGLPQAYAVLDPWREDCKSGLRELCGCGLAFFVSMALRKRGRELGWFSAERGRPEPNLKQHLDLVTIATAADMVPLTGANRVLVKHGLEVLRHSLKPGVRALLQVSGLSKRDLSAGHLGFVLGPRINASGRIESASHALELLMTSDGPRGLELAERLERLNEERSALQDQIWDEVKAQVETGLAQGRFRAGIVVANSNWHEGVVGIVASRVTEFFRKPAAVISIREDLAKGSVRSFGGKDVLRALIECKEYLLGFGGHKHAAGLSLEPTDEKIGAFAEAFDRAIENLPEDKNRNPLWVDEVVTVGDFSVKVLMELERLGPFGVQNPEPQFQIEARGIDARVIKDRHLRVALKGTDTQVDGIWFHALDREDIKMWIQNPGPSRQVLDAVWLGVPELNRFRGKVTPNFRVKDFKPREGNA